jgi:hypothetical protein
MAFIFFLDISTIKLRTHLRNQLKLTEVFGKIRRMYLIFLNVCIIMTIEILNDLRTPVTIHVKHIEVVVLTHSNTDHHAQTDSNAGNLHSEFCKIKCAQFAEY